MQYVRGWSTTSTALHEPQCDRKRRGRVGEVCGGGWSHLVQRGVGKDERRRWRQWSLRHRLRERSFDSIIEHLIWKNGLLIRRRSGRFEMTPGDTELNDWIMGTNTSRMGSQQIRIKENNDSWKPQVKLRKEKGLCRDSHIQSRPVSFEMFTGWQKTKSEKCNIQL